MNRISKGGLYGAGYWEELDRKFLDLMRSGAAPSLIKRFWHNVGMTRTRNFHLDYVNDIVIEEGQPINREDLVNAGVDDQNVLWFEQRYEDFLNANGYDHFKLPLPGKLKVEITDGSAGSSGEENWKMSGECHHKWKLYNGFMNTFYYCEICDVKKEK